ncbi:hypothetical protein [Mechercharimyces sp. CAU 1602]|uniref:hypothetical protein n=1 Tax=Mechercharimyces sp. CAU 1602 TaxID=2973933 RepID=UPI0021633997|nr:hypothetical protein [Mechercharimyces sp. CAU 1602]MCS1352802.1 hypothetical protein [Mechercharimyces sp. CAU 1602]
MNEKLQAKVNEARKHFDKIEHRLVLRKEKSEKFRNDLVEIGNQSGQYVDLYEKEKKRFGYTLEYDVRLWENVLAESKRAVEEIDYLLSLDEVHLASLDRVGREGQSLYNCEDDIKGFEDGELSGGCAWYKFHEMVDFQIEYNLKGDYNEADGSPLIEIDDISMTLWDLDQIY